MTQMVPLALPGGNIPDNNAPTLSHQKREAWAGLRQRSKTGSSVSRFSVGYDLNSKGRLANNIVALQNCTKTAVIGHEYC